ncbi:MAG: sulfatase-like hydrolase/transferase, partial [Planctomycetota bacterium]
APTRAAFLTGRYGFRNGIGGVGGGPGSGVLSLAELTLPEALNGYESACIGKWHLAGNQNLTHPTASGFDHYAGMIGGSVQNYFQWPLVENGSSNISSTYTTTELTDRAIQSVQTMQGPWFLYLSYNAPHTPFHLPPSGLCPTTGCTSPICSGLGPNPSNRELSKAMVEALDVELGRFLAALEAVDPNAFVFFMGDNGTGRQASEPPFTAAHAKGSIFEGGVNVPLIVRGPGVVRAESPALISVVDLFATMTELASMPMITEDSVSFAPTFSDPTRTPRSTVYSETFLPNGTTGVYTEHERCVRNDRYKLLRRLGETDEMYDLELDPFETVNLLPTLTPAQQTAFSELEAVLVQLGVD